MKNINYIKGDATAPKAIGNKVIVHICNDIGGWGKGFVLAISKRWKEPELKYREWFALKETFQLGECQFVKVEQDIWVANLIGQHKIYSDANGIPPIRYEAVEIGLGKVAKFVQEIKASIHMPRIGCGLAGGKWENIEAIVQKTIVSNEIDVTVYDF